MEFMQYNPKPTGSNINKMRFNQVQFKEAIEALEKRVAFLESIIKKLENVQPVAKKSKLETKEAK
jgi:uncharacterized coiled-coil protein SlyX